MGKEDGVVRVPLSIVMNITQELVDRIIKRAKASDFGLSDGLGYKHGHLDIKQYAQQDLTALAVLLVNGYDAKHDLISVFAAALHELTSCNHTELAQRLETVVAVFNQRDVDPVAAFVAIEQAKGTLETYKRNP